MEELNRTEKSLTDIKTELEIEKLKQEKIKLSLEQDKIAVETTEIKKWWFQKFASWPPLITAFIAIVTAAILFKNGLYDFREKKLQQQEAELEKKVIKLANDTLVYTRQISQLQQDAKSLANEVLSLRMQSEISANASEAAKLAANRAIDSLPTAIKESSRTILNLRLNNRIKSDSIYMLLKVLEHSALEIQNLERVIGRMGPYVQDSIRN